MDSKNRVVRIGLSRRTFEGILRGTLRFVGLPADFEVVRVYDDYQCDGIGVVVRSATFDPVDPGNCIPSKFWDVYVEGNSNA